MTRVVVSFGFDTLSLWLFSVVLVVVGLLFERARHPLLRVFAMGNDWLWFCNRRRGIDEGPLLAFSLELPVLSNRVAQKCEARRRKDRAFF